MAEQPLGPRPVEDEDVDLDLDAQDEALRREAVGAMTTVRIKGQVIHILHTADWDSQAMRAAVSAQWDTWASFVIPDAAELAIWDEANLHNYQMEAVFEKCASKARMAQGKLPRPTGPPRRTRRK